MHLSGSTYGGTLGTLFPYMYVCLLNTLGTLFLYVYVKYCIGNLYMLRLYNIGKIFFFFFLKVGSFRVPLEIEYIKVTTKAAVPIEEPHNMK